MISSISDVVFVVALSTGAIMCLATAIALVIRGHIGFGGSIVAGLGVVLIGLSIWQDVTLKATKDGLDLQLRIFERSKDAIQSAAAEVESTAEATEKVEMAIQNPVPANTIRDGASTLVSNLQRQVDTLQQSLIQLQSERETISNLRTDSMIQLPFGARTRIPNPQAEQTKMSQLMQIDHQVVMLQAQIAAATTALEKDRSELQ